MAESCVAAPVGSNVLNSTLYALAINEVVGGSHSIRRAAGTPVPDCGSHASVAQHFRLVRARTSPVGNPQPCNCQKHAPFSPCLSAGLRVRGPLVHRQLLLGPRHNAPLRGYADGRADAAADRLQPCPRPLLRIIRSWPHAGTAGDREAEGGADCRTFSVGCP